MKRSDKKNTIAAMLLGALLVAGCSPQASGTAASAVSAASTAAAASSSAADSAVKTASLDAAALDAAKQANFKDNDAVTDWSKDKSTSIALSDSGATIEGAGASAKGNVVTISEAGTYIIAGTIADGRIVVDAPKDAKVYLVLNGAHIANASGPAIYVKQSDKTIVTLQEGTDNSVSDATAYADTSEEAAIGAIFSKSDLTINGTGKLTAQGRYKDAIVSKDDLKIMSGTIDIQAADDGIVGRDLFAVKAGSITIKAGGDGIKTTNDTAADKGVVAITGGAFNITSANDGIQAESVMLIGGGSFDIVSGGGSTASTKTHQEERGFGGPGQMQPQQQAQTAAAAASTETETESAKGLKAKGTIAVTDGKFRIDAADDAIHSNDSVSIAGGQYSIATGDDAIHADKTVTISNGTIDITKSYEGIEGENVSIAGGTVHLVSQDDGVNVSGGDSQPAGGKGAAAAASGKLTISGGYIYVNAAGDGLDSNGSMVMTGGVAIVNGPTNNGNGALDYDGTFEQSGGTLIAAGSAGMAQAPSDSSVQRAIHMTLPSTLQAGTLVTVTDSAGKTVTAFTPAKSFNSIVISSPELKAGESYTISTGGSSTGKATDGLYDGGTVSGSTKVVTFTLGDKVTYVNQSGVTTANTGGGPGGGFGGGRGGAGGPAGGGRGRQ